MKKISILSLHLGYGGIERCITNLANNLVDYYDIEILCLYKLYDEPAFKIDPRVKVTYLTNIKPNHEDLRYAIKSLNIFKIIKEGIKSLKILNIKRKTTIETIESCNSDILISTRDYFNKYTGIYKNNNIYTIGWEHNHHHNNTKYIKKLRKSCINLDKLVVVSKDLEKFYKKDFKDNNIKCNVVYIPNYIDSISKETTKLTKNNLISVGRLSPEKGFLDLIDIIKEVKETIPNIKLTLVGEGKEEKIILDKIIKNNLSKNIKMTGYLSQEEIDKLYLNSSLYIMTSYTESFGLVLIEAMRYGLPALCFSSSEGPREIIKNDINGYLIDNRDKHEMAKKIIYLLKNKDKLEELSNKTKPSIKEYTKEYVIDTWIKLIGE